MDYLRQQLIDEEGIRALPYRCSEGYLTVGIGHNLDVPMDKELIDLIFEYDVKKAMRQLVLKFPIVSGLDEVRRAALISMSFQLGLEGLAAFRKMWAALDQRDFKTAAAEALDSKWAKVDTPARAKRVAKQLETGEWQWQK